MAGGTLWIKVLPEKGTEAAIQQAVQRGGQQAEGTSKDSGSRWGLGFAAAAGVAIGRGLQQAAALEQVEVGLTTMLGSAGAAREMLGELTDFARDTPFEMQGLAANARQLLGVGAAADDVIPTLQVLGDASAALGLSQEQMDRVLRAVTQSMAKGKFQAEEMMQMAEAGIPIYDLMARAVGKSVPEMQEMSKEGALLADDVLPKLLAVMQQDYAGGMVAQSKTLNGVLSTLKDDVNLGLAEAVKFLIPILADLLPSAAKAATGGIEVFGTGLRVAVTLATPLIQLLDALMEGFGSLPAPIQHAVVAALLLGRVMGAGGLVSNLLSFTRSLVASRVEIVANARAAGTFTGAVGAVGRGAAKAAGKTGLGALAGALGGKWGAAAIGIGMVVMAIIDIANNAEEARAKVEALVGDIDFSASGGGRSTAEAIRDLRDNIAELESTQGGWTGPRFLNEIWSDFDEQIDASKDKMEELARAQAGYRVNSAQLADSLGITVHQLERLALAAGLDLNLLAGDREDVALFTEGLRGANAAIEGGYDPTSALGEAMTTLGDGAATAADKTDALKTALDVLAGNQVGVLEATAQWQESLAGLAEALQTTNDKGKTVMNDLAIASVDAAGKIDLTSEAGRELQGAVLTAADAMRTSAAAARDQAIASGDVAGAADAAGAAAQRARDDFIAQAVQLGLTKQQAAGLADQYGLIPGSVVTAVATPGMSQAQLAAALLKGKVEDIPNSKTVITSALTADAVSRLEGLGYKVTHLPNGQVSVTALTGDAEAAIAELTRQRTMRVFVEATYSGTRAGGLFQADGGRVEFYAGGGMRAKGHQLTPMRANWAQVVPANTWRVIGDRPRGREWYVPEDAPNTLPVLADAAAAHGLALVRAMADGGLLGKPMTRTAVAAPSRVTNIQNNLTAVPSLPTIGQLERMQRKAEVLAGA